MIFTSKPKVKFYSSIPGVIENYPIIKASSYKRKWTYNAAEAFKETTKNLQNYQNTLTGVVKCPGVFDIMNSGWIVTAWCDFIIDVNRDYNTINWHVPPMMQSVTSGDDFNKPIITFISTQNPAMSIPICGDDNHCLVKIHTPWTAEIPKGWSLLVLPVSYSDETRFKATEGILKPADHIEINPQLYWKVIHGTELVKAGTPLCQIIPVKDNDIDFECLDFSDEQRLNQKKMYFKRASTYVRKI